MFTEYDRQQWIERINAPKWPRVFDFQIADVFVPDLCILDSELQFLVLYWVLLIPNYSFLVLYCVLLIPNYSFWFCTGSS